MGLDHVRICIGRVYDRVGRLPGTQTSAIRPSKARVRRPGLSTQKDLGFCFDDKEGVGVGEAGGTELLEGVVEGCSEDGEDYGAVAAAYEVEAALLLDEF